jgi:FKBP-type peptidyl-prolyl cis-trans isomerase
MTPGDSAIFYLSADSLFLKTFRVKELPKYVKPGSTVKAFVKMLKMQPGDEFKAELQAKFEAEAKKAELEKGKEDSILAIFLKEKGINAKPTKSGLYYVEVQKGNGPIAIPGTKVKVHYTGTLLNGKKFDSSLDRNQPFEFELGKGMVIKGWEEGIAMMAVGGKAKLIIPSRLGYGERGAPPSIGPYSTLVFDVELIDVKQPEVKK